MARKKGTWLCSTLYPYDQSLYCVVIEEDTGHAFQILNAEYTSFTTSEANKGKRFQIIGYFREESVAVNFADLLNKNASTDTYAMLIIQNEHFKKFIMSGEKYHSYDKDELEQAIRDVASKTGRKCIGKCASLQHDKDCGACYMKDPKLWTMCANITSMSIIHEADRGE